MIKHTPKFNQASLFVCSKCGKDFSEPDNAENLKTSLRSELKNENKDHLKIRVMVSSCLGVCEKGEQAFGYYPNKGELELYSIPKAELKLDKKNPPGHEKILEFIKTKLVGS